MDLVKMSRVIPLENENRYDIILSRTPDRQAFLYRTLYPEMCRKTSEKEEYCMISMPCIYEETPTGIVQKDAFSLLLSHRIILLFDQITDDTACMIVAQLLALEAKDPKKDIQLYINSGGGGVRAGLAIYDTMRHIKADVATVCVGQAASMGAFLLAAGTKGKRYSLENSSIMIHQALGAIGYAQTTDIQIQANMMADTKRQLNRLLAGSTGRTEDEIERRTERDHYMTPEQAKEFGLIDHIIGGGEL